MATRKQLRKRTRKQRGGGFFNAIAGVAEKIKGFFSKPTDSFGPSSPGVKNPPPLGTKATPSSNAVAIQMPATPPSQPAIKVNKPLNLSNSAIQVSTPQEGLTGSLSGVGISPSSAAPPTLTAIQMPPPSEAPQLSAIGGRRKKHRHTRKCKKMHNKRK